MQDNYPPGAANDPNAPWNQEEDQFEQMLVGLNIDIMELLEKRAEAEYETKFKYLSVEEACEVMRDVAWDLEEDHNIE